MNRLLFSLFFLFSMNALAQVKLPSYHIQGLLSGKTQIIIALEVRDGVAAGYVYYPKASAPAPIMVAGVTDTYPDANSNARTPQAVSVPKKLFRTFNLMEYGANGEVSGVLYLKLHEAGNRIRFVEGKWSHPVLSKNMELTGATLFPVMPNWFKESLLVPASPSEVPGLYQYSIYDEYHDVTMGGDAEFVTVSPNRLNFSISNSTHGNGAAFLKNMEGRPARLYGNEFEYSEANECHCGFETVFFKRFVYVKTTAGFMDQNKCFGDNTIDGFYIKQP